METTFNPMQTIKRRFFAMRNGIVADTLRKAGSPFHVIFGLNIPQIAEIAREVPSLHAPALAEALWANRTTRESMLIAPMLMAPESIDINQAEKLLREAPCDEVTDILCHRLLSRLPFSLQLAAKLGTDSADNMRYASLRLMFNLVAAHPAEAAELAASELKRECPRTRRIASALAEEADFLLNG